jgi:hypothetical protein
VTSDGQALPEDEALMADSVGLALQVVLGTLSPAERLLADSSMDDCGKAAKITRYLQRRSDAHGP